MEIKANEIFEFLGVKDVDSLDKFKEAFEKDFLRVSTLTGKEDALKPFFGKAIGGLETKLKAIAKKHNAEWTKDYEGKDLHEKIEYSFGRVIEDNNKVVDELKRQSGQGNDEKVKEWQEKYTKIESKNKDLSSLLESTKGEFETYKQRKDREAKSMKLDFVKGEALKKIKYKAGLSDIEQKGFMAVLNEKYNVDMDEKGEAFITDKQGQRLKSAKVTGTFKTIDEVFNEEAIASKIVETNPHAGKQTGMGQQTQNIQVLSNGKPKYVHPNALI